MFGKHFELNAETLPIVEGIGNHMPGGFFLYRAEGEQEILYANQAVHTIFGCRSGEEFAALTGGCFRGMVYPEDYAPVTDSYRMPPEGNEADRDHMEYRIVRRDGTVRWVEDYGHFTRTDAYGGIYYVFISDITEKRERMESDMAVRQAAMEALSQAYHTVWLIHDVESESFSLYRGDISGETAHAIPIRDALGQRQYSQAKEYYIRTTVAPVDQERLQRELTLKNIARRLKEKPQFNVNYLRRMDDGSERYFRIEFAKMTMPGGRMGVVCGFKDVDDDVREGQAVQRALQEAKRAEEENRRLVKEIESAEKLAALMGSVASLLTNMPAMSFSKDARTGVYLACNQAFAEYAHKETPEGVVGLTDHQIFDPVTASHFVEDDRKALAMDEPYIFFEDVPDAAGNPRSFQTTKMKYTDGNGRLCTLGMCVDVTEMTKVKAAETEARVKQQELEQRLALQEQLLEQERQKAQQHSLITALASDSWSVYYLDLDKDEGVCYQESGEETDFHMGDHFPYLANITAYARQYVTEAYREEFLRFVQPDAIRERLRQQRVISYRYLIHRDGTERYVMIRFAGVRHPEDRNDGIVHAVGLSFTDVDAETRQTLEQNQALGAALAAAEEASRAKTAFLSNMSHEIRTPMNAIIGLDSIALNDPDIPDRTRTHLEKIGAAAQHLLNIINDILDMSRIESGRMTVRREEFSFSKTLEQVNTMISGQCRTKGLTYECRVRGVLADRYIGDDMKLRQVLLNILGNAVKFTPAGGSVSFLIEETARFDGKATLRFTIADTGIGMSEDYLPHLFEAFSQEDSSVTNKFGSTGLGMPITKSLVEMMNGNIQVESEKGKGTTFTVTVTLTETEQEDEKAQDGELHPHELSVLVIDDDPVDREHAAVVLGQLGVVCESASSGEEGVRMVKLRHARREPYNLILVDWKMPDMDGLETTRRIRALVGSDTPIIILTAYNWDHVEENARQAGVDSFVAKPLFANSVLDEFREAFRKKNRLRAGVRAELKGRRILLAEDMPVNAEIMTMVLAMRQIRVDHAENGKAAVDLFAASPEGAYDAVLMDMRMPVMDGLEAARRIREMDRRDAGTVPIIALTANAFDEDVQRSMQAGLNAHLSKPIEPEILFETLETLIRP